MTPFFNVSPVIHIHRVRADDIVCIAMPRAHARKRKRIDAVEPRSERARFPNRYRGYAPARGERLPRLPYGSLAPNDFHARFVSTRMPVVFTDVVKRGSDFAAASTWTDEFLRARCGGSRVRVETRVGGRFGRGVYRDETFASFMDKFAKRDCAVYLSAGGKREAFDGPARALTYAGAGDASERGLFPLRPRAMPESLVPADVNLWMGRAERGKTTSSGLHHDFHDNLYVLLRGEKRFKLYAPSEAEKMYTHGDIRCVHENGLINYEKFPGTLQDGDVALESGETALERRVRLARQSVIDGDEDKDGEDGEDGEEDDGEPSFGDDEFDGVDDFDELEESISADSSIEDARGDEMEAKALSAACDPASFSRVDYDTLDRFPLFKDAACIEVTVRAGEALYLPAGWFHDVSSGELDDDCGHCAFNFWFHPPLLGEQWSARRALWEEDFKRSVVDKLYSDGEANVT